MIEMDNRASTVRDLWPISLLWPAGESPGTSVGLSETTIADLALDHIVHAIDQTGQYGRVLRGFLCDPCLDPTVIRYRQDILEDILRQPELQAGLRTMVIDLQALRQPGGFNWPGESPLGPILTRIRELDHFVHCVDRLDAFLRNASDLRSDGLRNLRLAIANLAANPDVVTLRTELPALHEMIGETASVTIGLNLGRDLQPESATIVEFNRFHFRGTRSLLGRLLPGATGNGPTGVTPLQHAGPASLRRDSQLFQDLQRLLEDVTAPLNRALIRYRELNAAPLLVLENEFAWWSGTAALIERLIHAGIPMCRPEIAPSEERACTVTEGANIALALQMQREQPPRSEQIVRNDIRFDPPVRLLMVTGPNRGGKTTFCRAAGQAQVLFQCGLYVPGTSARISPVDAIWTHFPLPEADQPGAGRLDEELGRLRTIFDRATPTSLILLNEPLTSTSEHDALTIARDLVRALQILGARTILITHLHDLALAIPELNRQGPADTAILSLAAQTGNGTGDIQGTFRIIPGPPAGHSHAAGIARQHGLTFEQLRDLLDARATEDHLA